jgi:hypothetical protein
MNRRSRRLCRFAALLGLIGFSSGEESVRACGPFTPRAIFRYTAHPEFPLEPYAAGMLGIVSPGWSRSQLVVAYRYLVGMPLDRGEQAGAVALWHARYGLSRKSNSRDPADEWLDARRKIPGLPPSEPIRTYRYEQQYFQGWLNCGDDAFHTAAVTLADRLTRYPGQPAMVRDWAAAQDAVFSNCGGDRPGRPAASTASGAKPAVVLPSPAPEGAPDWLKADRQYQAAAAMFYATDFAGAERGFRAIAANAASPWRPIAPYLVARALIRSETVGNSIKGLDDAERELRRILADPAEAPIHRRAGELLSYVRGQQDPAARATELAERLRRRIAPLEFQRDLADFTLLLDRAIGESPELYATRADEALDRPTARHDDLTDWILTFQEDGPLARRYATERWRFTSALPWLLAALSKATPTDPDVAALLDAGSHVSPRSAGYQTALYHVLRLRLAGGQADAVRSALDALLPEARDAWPRSALNAMLALRMSVARSLDEALPFAARRPAGSTDGVDDRELPPFDAAAPDASSTRPKELEPAFDDDFGRLVNSAVPVRRLVDAARSDQLPVRLRRDLALAAWSRAALLGDAGVAIDAGVLAGVAYPAMKPLLDQYAAAPDEAGRLFAVAFTALRFPGVRPKVTVNLGRVTPVDQIDDYRDNWWCAQPEAPPEVSPLPVSEAEHQQALSEWMRIGKLPSAPEYLSAIAIAWAKSHPADSRVPEALHLAVRSTRFGCAGPATSMRSKEAFTLLHRKYPASEWTKRTPYYY